MIHILPDDVISQIAAGEVIERPASVVKELMENSLDATATALDIRVSQAGKRMIEVADDGVGIPVSELKLATSRHATSKLRTAEDLFSMKTLGFRGEALASIASISRFTLISRQKDGISGAKLYVDGGKASELETVGVPAGTVVRVQDLFYNVPARLKFLKTDPTERRQIDSLVTRYALAYPDIRWQLSHDDRVVLQTSGGGDRREILAQLYGVDTARQMLEIYLTESENVHLQGFTSPVGLTRSNRKEITFFVNGRWVQDSTLVAALLKAYHTRLMTGRYPISTIFLQIPPDFVDVNVHPTKAEVRFREQDYIFSLVQRGIKRALMAYTSAPSDVRAATTWKNRSNTEIDPSWQMAADLNFNSDSLGWRSSDADEESAESLEVLATQQPLSEDMEPILRLVGQIGNTYLVAEGPDGLYLIDQHSAHERVLFERFQHYTQEGAMPSQALLRTETIQLPPERAGLLLENLGVLKEIGFDIEEFGQNTFIIRAIPAILYRSNPVAVVQSVVEDFEEDESPLENVLEDRLIARICKRAAVKAGQSLSIDEQSALLRDLEGCQSPRTCPHGRPTMIHLSVDLLERQFGRKGKV